MKKVIIIVIVSLFVIACGNDKKTKVDSEPKEIKEKVFDDSEYVLDVNHPVGDVRRYGVFPDSIHSVGHPFTKKTRIETILDLSSEHNIEMTFPKGYYNSALIIKGKKNVNLKFDNASFGGMIQIFENDSIGSDNISFKGNLITYGGFFSRKSSNINIEDLIIKTNVDKNIYSLRSKGCKIFAGTKNISIQNLVIDDLGSGSEKYKYVSAALTIEGWNSNPINVQIKKVHIKSSDRHGIYMTGSDHLIGEVIIDKFGIGSSKNISTMGDAVEGEEKEFKALWINKCYNSFIESVVINEKDSKGKYTAHFDYGDKEQPVSIGSFKVLNDNPKITILEDEHSGVVIEE